MKRTDFFYGAITVLVILNIAVLTFLWQHRPHSRQAQPQPRMSGQPPAGPREFIIRELGFDETQRQAFEALRNKHRRLMKENRDAVQACRNELYTLLPKNDTKRAALLAEKIGVLEKEKELLTFENFREIRVLCRGQQKEKLDTIMREVLRLMAQPRPPQEQSIEKKR